MPSVNTGPELTPQACAPLASRGPRTVREADRLSPAVARSWAAGKLLSAAGEERLSRNAASGRGSVLPAPTYRRGWTRTTATSVYVCVDLHRWFRTRFGRRAPPLLFPCAPDGALRLRGQISGDGVLLPGCAFTSSVPLSGLSWTQLGRGGVGASTASPTYAFLRLLVGLLSLLVLQLLASSACVVQQSARPIRASHRRQEYRSNQQPCSVPASSTSSSWCPSR